MAVPGTGLALAVSLAKLHLLVLYSLGIIDYQIYCLKVHPSAGLRPRIYDTEGRGKDRKETEYVRMLREGLGTIESKTKETLPRRMRPRIAWQPPPQRLLLWILNLKSTTQWQRSSKVWTRKCRMKKPKEVPDTSLRSSKLKRTQLAKSKKYKARLVARGYMSSTIMEPTHPFPEWRPFEQPSEYETNNLIVKSIIWVKTRCENWCDALRLYRALLELGFTRCEGWSQGAN